MNNRDAIVRITSAPVSALAGSLIDVNWEIQNVGDLSFLLNSSLTVSIYLSKNDQLDETDILLSTSSSYLDGDLAFNETIQGRNTVNLDLRNGLPGDYHLIIKSNLVYNENGIDYNDENLANNVAARGILIQEPDLVITTASAPVTVQQGESIAVSWVVTNQGDATAATNQYFSSPYDAVYLSADSNIDPSLLERYGGSSLTIQSSGNLLSSVNRDVLLTDAYVGNNLPLAPQSSYTKQQIVTIPFGTVPGQQYLVFQANSWGGNGGVKEVTGLNNFYIQPIIVQASGFDLKLDPLAAPTSVVLGENFNVQWQVTNLGNKSIPKKIPNQYGGQSDYYHYDAVYISNDRILDSTDLILESRYIGQQSSLDTGASYSQTSNTFNIIDPTYTGNRYLLFGTDINQNLGEDNEANNVWAVPIEIQGKRIKKNIELLLNQSS